MSGRADLYHPLNGETADPHIGYGGFLSGRADLNRRPPRPKRGALTELRYAPSGESIIPSMDNRQAKKLLILTVAIHAAIWACSPLNMLSAAPTPVPVPFATPTRIPPSTPTSFPVPTQTPTPHPCLGETGQVDVVAFDAEALPQFHIYLPTCYDENPTQRYPVLYLIHGQGYTDEQWVRLGAPSAASQLIAEDKIPPFIIVMPHDKASWRMAPDDYFGEALIDELIPYIDANYRTLIKPESRAIGGLSRGAGWAIHYGLTRWDLFGAFGAHSPAIFYNDNSKLDEWIAAIPPASWPQIYIDIGDNDKEHGSTRLFGDLLMENGVPHEWHLYAGVHTEDYWRAHVAEYLLWYGGVLK